MSEPYLEAMAMLLAVSYIPYAKSSKEKTDNIITFGHFEEGGFLSGTRNDMESGNEYDDDSTIPPLISEEKMGAMSSGDEYNSELMYMDVLEDIHDGSQYHPKINRI